MLSSFDGREIAQIHSLLRLAAQSEVFAWNLTHEPRAVQLRVALIPNHELRRAHTPVIEVRIYLVSAIK